MLDGPPTPAPIGATAMMGEHFKSPLSPSSYCPDRNNCDLSSTLTCTEMCIFFPTDMVLPLYYVLRGYGFIFLN